MTAVATEQHPDAVWHRALFYESADQYVDGVLHFVRAALRAGRPVFVSVPAANGALLRRHLDGTADRVRFADMARVGRNPSCIIPAIQAFIDENRGRKVSFVGEPIWAGRAPAEVAEATRHEALINAAFAGTGAEVLCPYDVAGLDADVVADAFRTHPELVDGAGRRLRSERYEQPGIVWHEVGYLPPPPVGAERIVVDGAGLAELRDYLRRIASAAGLDEPRADELLLAASELAANGVVYGDGTATATVWSEGKRALCEIADAGVVRDPLVGRRRPASGATSGRGLWLVNQLCDLVQLHSSTAGTRVRITVSNLDC